MTAQTKRVDREGIDTILLILAFVSGIGSALILKIIGLPTWMPALVAGAVIILYAVVTYSSSTARLEPEQIGDNCYYLGFCITLASLAYTLYGLGSAGSDAAMLGDVISGFGVALSSTVVGVMTRVVLLQFRVDLAARDKEVRTQLNQVMRSFHGEMQSAVTSTVETSTQIRQALEEHTSAMIAQNTRLQESFETRIATLVEEAVTGVKSAMTEVVDSGKDMNRRLSASSRANMTTTEKAMQASMEVVTEDLKRAASALEVEMKRANDTSVKSLERVVTEVSAAMTLLSAEASKSIQALREAQSAEMTRAVEVVASNVLELSAQIGAQKDKLRGALEGFAEQTERARQEAGHLARESAAAREDARKAAEDVAVASRQVADAAERMEKAAKEISAARPAAAANGPEVNVESRDTAPTSAFVTGFGIARAGTSSPATGSAAIWMDEPVSQSNSTISRATLASSTAVSAAKGYLADVSQAQKRPGFTTWLGERK